MNRKKLKTPSELLKPLAECWKEDYHKFQKSSKQGRRLQPFMEFLLVFLYFVGGKTYEEIFVEYSTVTVRQLEVIIHNGGFIVSALWVPHYFCQLSPREIFENHTPALLKLLLGKRYGQGKVILSILSDPKEIVCETPWSDLHLMALLYSSKLKKFHSVKLGAFTAPNGYFLYRSPLLGGMSDEVQTLKKCPYLTEAGEMCQDVAGIVIVFDRGGK